MTVFWIFVCSAAIVAAAYFAGKPRRDKMIADKKIVARPYEWYKNAEVFTLYGEDFDSDE